MGNSTTTVQDVADDARTFPELAPALATGGFSDQPAVSIASDVLQTMIAGGPDGNPFNWKWNRTLETTFFLNSWQQDYFVPGLVSLGWLESCTAVNFSSTQYPKPVRPVTCKRDLLITNAQNNGVGTICWMNNDTLQCGAWGVAQSLSTTGQANPGPGVTITNPQGMITMPTNPTTCIKDAFGNLWVVTTYGVCGSTNPFLSNQNPNGLYPTLQSPSTAAITVADGSVIWTAVNPKGQGFRLSPIPGQTGPVWQICPVGQNKVAKLTKLTDFIDPVPDEYLTNFKQGFNAQCFRRSPDPKVRAKFEMEWTMWLKSLNNAVKQGSREEDDWGFYVCAGNGVMDTGNAYTSPSPSQPYWNN